jgi:hypothetical protein
MQREISRQDACLITNTFPLAGGRRFAKQQRLRCNRHNRSGRSCAAAPVLDRPTKCVIAPISCANCVTDRLSNLGWRHRSLHPAALSRRSQLIQLGQQRCWFRGSGRCCGSIKCGEAKAARGRARTPKAVAKRLTAAPLNFARSAFGVRCVHASLSFSASPESRPVR